MSNETLTTWTCERCGYEATIEGSADEYPRFWQSIMWEKPGDNGEILTVESDLCPNCNFAMLVFMDNKPVGAQVNS